MQNDTYKYLLKRVISYHLHTQPSLISLMLQIMITMSTNGSQSQRLVRCMLTDYARRACTSTPSWPSNISF